MNKPKNFICCCCKTEFNNDLLKAAFKKHDECFTKEFEQIVSDDILQKIEDEICLIKSCPNCYAPFFEIEEV